MDLLGITNLLERHLVNRDNSAGWSAKGRPRDNGSGWRLLWKYLGWGLSGVYFII
jgi:hypothetical protein